MLMEHFDDRGFEKQLGKERQAMDYRLAHVVLQPTAEKE